MRDLMICILIGALSVALGCGDAEETVPGQSATTSVEPTTAAPELLEPPFTSQQIREAWVEGLELEIRRVMDGTEVLERWVVTAADSKGATIASVVIDAAGNPTSETKSQLSSWDELRDHASFAADRAQRRKATRSTALGTFDGWLYTVANPSNGAVSEYFFAESLPGAPLTMRVVRDGRVVVDFEQLERRRPDADPR